MSQDDVNAIHASLEEIKTALAVLTNEVAHACKDVAEVCEDVRGNGKVGLKSQLHEHLVRHDERRNLLTWMASIGGSGGIVGTIAGMVALFS